MTYQALLATKYAVTDYGKETIQAIAEWKGRCFQNGVRNTLLGVGGVGSLVAIYEFANPLIQTTAPGWLIGTVVGGVSVVAIVGGICLYASSPPKFEEIVVRLKENLDRFEAENQRFKKNVKVFDGELDKFESFNEGTRDTYHNFEVKWDGEVTVIEGLCGDLGNTNEGMKAANTAITETTIELKNQVDRLENLARVFSNDPIIPNNSNYTINDQHDTIIDMSDAQARLARHNAYLTQSKGSG